MSETPSTPELSVAISPHEKLPKGIKEEKVLEAASFVLEIFLAHLESEMPLDGAKHVEIRLGDAGDDPRYERKKNSSVVYQPSFDFKQWKKEGDEVMLTALSGILDRITHAFRGDRKQVQAAARNVVKSNFEARIPAKDLGSPIPEGLGGSEVEVVRIVNPKGEDWVLEVQGKKGRVLKRVTIVTGLSHGEDGPGFSGYKWKGSEFVLLGPKGKPAFTLDLDAA